MNQGLDTTGDTYRRQQFFHQLFCDQAERVPPVPESHRQTHHDIRSLLKLYQRRSQRLYRQSLQEVLAAIFAGACERVFGRTSALQSHSEHLEYFRSHAVQWVPEFLHAPKIRAPLPAPSESGRWSLLQDPWDPVACVPSSFPWPALTWGASVVRTRSGTAPRHLRDLAVLSRCSGESLRPRNPANASGPSIPAAPRRRAPAARVHPCGRSARNPPLRSAPARLPF